MTPDMSVWHGLSQKMVFKEFSAYFDCPTSTTTELTVAARFSGGEGIVLKLKPKYKKDTVMMLDVSHFSNYPDGMLPHSSCRFLVIELSGLL